MNFNDLLVSKDIEPNHVMILRHRPKEPELRKVLPWLANENHEVFNAYQQTQGPIVEKAMQRAKFVASFIGHEPGKGVFVGLYEVSGAKPTAAQELWTIPSYMELIAFGMPGPSGVRPTILWFDLILLDSYSEWKGKLIVKWPPPERSWWRWADRNLLPVSAILEDSLLVREMPHWTRLTLSWKQLQVLPTKWSVILSQWRGIYFILDTSDGKGYVGAAYGQENLLGRWVNYAKSGHGGNKQLRDRDPANFRFSILQRVSPDMDPDDVQTIEAGWKDRLHVREFGLNEN